jgi:hypothetical protein
MTKRNYSLLSSSSIFYHRMGDWRGTIYAILPRCMVTPQAGVEAHLTQPGTAVFTGRYDQIHAPTTAPGVGSMPQLWL